MKELNILSLFILLFAFISNFSFAYSATNNNENVSRGKNEKKEIGFDVVLTDVSIVDLSRIIIEEINKGNLVISNEVFTNTQTVHFSLKKQSASDLLTHLRTVLGFYGFSLIEKNNVFFIDIEKDVEVAKELFIYKPKRRSVEYLSEYIIGIFGKNVLVSDKNNSKTNKDFVKKSISNKSNNNLFGSDSLSQNLSSSKNDVSESSFVSSSLAEYLVINADPEKISKIKQILSAVDSELEEVAIRAYLVEVHDNETKSKGFSFLLDFLTRGIGELSINFSNDTSSGFNGISFKNFNLDLFYKALETTSNVRLLSSPFLKVISGETASLSVGSEVPVLGSVQYTTTGSSVQNVIYRNSGVLFDFLPRVFNNSVDLSVRQVNSSFVKTETGVNNSPTLLKREISTRIFSNVGDLIVLGGLDELNDQKEQSGLFFLPKFLDYHGDTLKNSQVFLLFYIESIEKK